VCRCGCCVTTTSSVCCVRSGVDPFSGYRSYAASQLDRANRLVALKDLGFTLEQVGLMLDGGMSSSAVADLLRERREALAMQIDADLQRLREVETRLRSIEKENPMSEYTEGPLAELHVVQLSTKVNEMAQIEQEIGGMFQRVGELIAAAGASHVGPGVAVYTTVDDGMIAAAAEQIGDAPVPDGLEAAVVPPHPRAVSTRLDAPDLSGIQSAWQGLVGEIERRGLQPDGPSREIYEQTPYDGPGARWIIDLQQPVA
jgi:DNA-binding transcriptional MerR regulator